MAMFSATRLQVATYLLGVCPFSIAFLVFLNSSVSFVVTDLIGREHGVGDAVGSLGFADELLALVACPLWGLISDRIGVRYVCVSAYLIVGLSLVLFVQARNVYPQLLLGRLLFSLGGAAATTMVTAVLPVVSSSGSLASSRAGSPAPVTQSHTHSPSVTSELTITPDRFRSIHSQSRHESVSARDSYASTSRIAGLVGMFTGCGALIALVVFLPLPASFQKRGVHPDRALQYSFYIVAAVAFTLAIWCFLGLRRLAYEANLHRDRSKRIHWLEQVLVVGGNLRRALNAGFQRSDICLGYLGGAVARASSVGISLFIPLLVNALFSSSHLCQPESASDSPAGLPGLKRQCPRAYIVAAQMTGISEMVALISAPVFGYVSSKTSRKGLPMMVASACGLVGYTLLPTQFSPDDKDKGRRAVAFLAVSLIGVSQIGAIVCSLGVLSHGVLAQEQPQLPPDTFDASLDETEALLESADDQKTSSSSLLELKGAVAGIYSFYGGAAILVLTKLGGSLFDSVSFGAPFYMMAALNAILSLRAPKALTLRAMDFEAQRDENLKYKAKLLADLQLESQHGSAKPSVKRRKQALDSTPTRSSARIASSHRPLYQEDADRYNPLERRQRFHPSYATGKDSEPDPGSVVPVADAEALRAGWTRWKPVAPCPVRDEDGTYHFEDFPSFNPNKSPDEIIREGCFGGSYFRKLRSKKLGIVIEDDWQELPRTWYDGLDVEKFLTHSDYDSTVNKYRVACGQSIEEWEASGWINLEYDVRGWFQCAIQAQLSVTIGTIRYALKHQLSPQHKRAGRTPHLNQRDGDLLEAYVTSSRRDGRQRLSYKQLAAEVFPDRPSIGVAPASYAEGDDLSTLWYDPQKTVVYQPASTGAAGIVGAPPPDFIIVRNDPTTGSPPKDHQYRRLGDST
ncbi:hypothetical protein DV738_g4, partial [Chaetothyriales sp. CBS 135597]